LTRRTSAAVRVASPRIRVFAAAAIAVAYSTCVTIPFAVPVVSRTTSGPAVPGGAIPTCIPVISGIAFAARVAVAIAPAVSFPTAIVAFLGSRWCSLQG
jgi:hypothetical protein